MTTQIVREYDEITGLTDTEIQGLERFALANLSDEARGAGAVFTVSGGRVKAQNYVGIIETTEGNVIEILPKVDLAGGDLASFENIRSVFLEMLRDWRRVREARFPKASVRSVSRFEMWEVFFYLFLQSVVALTRRGIARHYRTVEGDLPYLRGRIMFPEHMRRRAVDSSQFFVAYDEFSADRPANRLIRSTLDLLARQTRQLQNQRLLHQLSIIFSGVPPSESPKSDWDLHQASFDRSMRHYSDVMPWVGLLLLQRGLTTFAGEHRNRALLFPMEQVFEDFVTASFTRYGQYAVCSQGPRCPLVTEDGTPRFRMEPDITLMRGGKPAFVLDAKWKPLKLRTEESGRGVVQADLYQLFAYGKKYGVRTVALIYPCNRGVAKPFRYRFDDDLALWCFPFDVRKPKKSVREAVRLLEAG